jgi:hypothetical protein
MSLNGVQIAAYADPAWMSAEPFSIPAGSPFHNGTNTLAVAVTSAGTASTGVQIVTIGGNANVPFGAPYVVWLDAAKGVTQSDGGVSVWADQSGHGNDATPFPTQPLPTYTPVSIGGLPTMHFDGDYVDAFGIADAPSLDWGTDDYAVVLVAKYTNATPDDSPATWGTLWDKNCGTGTFVGAAMWGIYPTGDPGGNQTTAMTARAENHQIAQVPITTDDGNPHVLAMRRTGTTLYVWADGVGSSGQVPLDDVSQTGCGVDIGGALQGDIAEIIAIHGTVSDATMSALEQSLRTKYGF